MMRPFLAALLVFTPVSAIAQDPVPPIDHGVRIGITYTPGVRPGLLVLGGPQTEVLDSVREILRRDLEYSDQFEVITLPGGDSLVLGLGGSGNTGPAGAGTGSFVNYSLYSALGADYAVAVLPQPAASEYAVTVFDVRGQVERARVRLTATDPRDGAFRMAVHRAADDVVRATAGELGIAATRLLFVRGGRLYRVDADGAALVPVTPSDVTAFSSAWHPSGARVAVSELLDGWGRIALYDVETTSRKVVAPTGDQLNISPDFSPDGQTLAFTRITEEGAEVYRYNLSRDCCLERLTVGRFSDNLSPTFSPDGRQIGFVSTRAGGTQIYVMAADGTGQELFAPFDYGVTGNSNAPSWSPDGLQVAFHRDVAGSPQVFVMDARSRVVRQLTSAGRNHDPTWAPDGRHIAFVSTRTGRRQVWIMDVETGRVRQLTTLGDARLPSWSPRIPEQTQP
jgi:TolB protein